MLIKPDKLQPGDKVATVSPSSGVAGDPDTRWRYDQGVRRLENDFGLEVVPMPNSLKGTDYLHENPGARAEDLMTAFKDERIKGIIANVGGKDCIQLLPYIDLDVIRENPKIFMGYSDITIPHLLMLKAGISSFYGPNVLTDFAENVEMASYTADMVKRVLFSNEIAGEIKAANEWAIEVLEWDEADKDKPLKMLENSGYELLQGSGIVQGRLIGGCMDVLETAKGTKIWPEAEDWENSILFLEVADGTLEPTRIKSWLRNYGAQGILHKVNGVIFGKPQDEMYFAEYKKVIQEVMKENDLENLPVLFNLNFGHTKPKTILPYGIPAKINCHDETFSILESGVK
ncbi:S66 peptidase family protein [Lentibacillus sp. CBA3610]|uniref:S66 family peptidase n=1 Tax=Lentibacillus sp. CBA3610 TaxID=2518176 RepID=UPI001594FABA|nr:S66 peptidase family protein [Lentibacillus sp. CBA3610]QKY68825.1 LD-carboxypeptidase [Lentibacillus sp. CBA3610]